MEQGFNWTGGTVVWVQEPNAIFFCMVVRGSFPVLDHQGKEVKDGVL